MLVARLGQLLVGLGWGQGRDAEHGGQPVPRIQRSAAASRTPSNGAPGSSALTELARLV